MSYNRQNRSNDEKPSKAIRGSLLLAINLLGQAKFLFQQQTPDQELAGKISRAILALEQLLQNQSKQC
jgi:ABC-type taurine transport system substrate-binding protein